MAIERITFAEQDIPALVRIVRRGLEGEPDGSLKESLSRQVQDLETYWERPYHEDRSGA